MEIPRYKERVVKQFRWKSQGASKKRGLTVLLELRTKVQGKRDLNVSLEVLRNK